MPIQTRIRLGVPGQEWFQDDAEFAVDGQSVDLGAVRLWLESGRRFIPLKDGSFAEADRAELAQVAQLLEEAGAMPGTSSSQLPLYQAPALEMLAELPDFTEVEPPPPKLTPDLQRG